MTALRFEGTVKTGDECRVDDDESANGAIRIDGVDVVDEIAEQRWSDNVRVLVNGEEIAKGLLFADIGWGYTEYTPMDSDEINVGEFDVIGRLQSMEGQHVVLVVEDF